MWQQLRICSAEFIVSPPGNFWQWQSLYSLCYFFHTLIALIWNMAILSCPPFRMEFWWPYLFINILWIMNHSSQRDSSPFQNKNTIREHIQIQGCVLLRRELSTLSWAKIILLASQSPSRNNHVPISQEQEPNIVINK